MSLEKNTAMERGFIFAMKLARLRVYKSAERDWYRMKRRYQSPAQRSIFVT